MALIRYGPDTDQMPLAAAALRGGADQTGGPGTGAGAASGKT